MSVLRPRGVLWLLPALPALGCRAPFDPQLVRERTASLYGAADVERSTPPPPRRTAVAPVPAEAEISERADLDAFVRFGLHHSARLRAAYERWRSGVERIAQVSSWPDPLLTFAQFLEQLQTRTGPQERRYGLSQTIPWFGKTDLRGDVARAAEELWQRVQAERLAVQREIAVAYADYGFLAQRIRITGEVVALLQQLEPVVQRRIQGGNAGQADLLRLQVEIGRVENELASHRQVRPAMSARLAAAMSFRGGGLLPLPALREAPTTDHQVADLLARAAERNPGLRGLGERVRRNESALALARREAWPDLSVGVDWFETGPAPTPVPGSGDDPVAVHLSVRLPIGRARYAAARREAEHELDSAHHELADLRLHLRADIELAAFEQGDAGRQVALYRDTLLPRARESLAVTRAAYRAGSASLLDLIDSERALLQFETAYWRACRDHWQSMARLEALVGDEVTS